MSRDGDGDLVGGTERGGELARRSSRVGSPRP